MNEFVGGVASAGPFDTKFPMILIFEAPDVSVPL